MVAGKEFVFGFKIAAALEGNFNAAFNGASTQVLKLNTKAKEYREIAKSVTQAMKKGIITYDSYANALGKLEQSYSSVMAKQKKYLEIQGSVNTAQTAMIKHGVNLLQFKEMGNTLMDLTKPAIAYESAMADVKKVVDFDTPRQFKEMSKDILSLSQNIPMTAEGLANIVAAGGQSGIARAELSDFAKAAAKMGVAFDISADQAGEMMAKWRTAFKMNQSQVVELADKINYLGNTTAASAPLISDVVRRIGPLGEIGGVASGEIAALGASMVGAGVESEVAATGIKNMILGMVAGESATKSQAAAFAKLGLDATDMAKRMQNDANGAIIDVLSKIQSLDKYEQASVLKNLFGSESLGAISPLLSNLDSLKENLNKVADSAKYTGSMEDEFAARSATTANSLQLMENKVNVAKIAIGNGLLPTITPLLEQLGKMATALGNVAEENPTLISGGVMLAGSIVGVAAAGSALAWVYNGLKLTIAGTKLAMLSLKNTTIGCTISTKASAFSAKALSVSQNLASLATTRLSFAQKSGAATSGIITAAQWAWNAALSANPIGAVIMAVVGLMAAGYMLYKNWDVVKAFFISLWESPAAAILAFATGPIGLIAYGGSLIIANWESIKTWFITLWENPSLAIDQFIAFVYDKFGAAMDWLGDKWNWLTSLFSQPISANVEASASAKGETKRLATGGIFNKGSFLTTFAEESGESAIPHTPNRRNIGLLAKTNEIMGNPLGGRGGITATFAPNINISGNADAQTVNQIQQVMNDTLADFERKLKALQNQKARVSYT